jgi:Glu-tRNA(Gln) amidotransferase subunit E-like FAD-binding protein
MEIDYKKLKFKSGLEIHQQLDTHKLFCSCPSIFRTDKPKETIKRKLHAVKGESGNIDVAAKFQAKENKTYFYETYDTTCLVELDEEPPHEINQEALKISLEISLLMNCKIIPITQIMRKTVINGSNTSGFQRTVMVARNGFIETSKGKVGINFILLEEDAARIVSKEKNKETYKLDRLGIPMVEVVTAPDIKDAEHAKEVALKIGEILRSCKVRRGIGTIRQDVNISIREEKRVEIKGMQNMDIFIKAINIEILRQKELSDSKKPTEMEVRNVLPEGTTEFLRPLPGSARMYPETDLPLLHISKEQINKIKRNLPKLRGEIEAELKNKALREDQIKDLMKDRNLFELFNNLYETHGNSMLIAKMILDYPKDFASRLNKDVWKIREILNENILEEILEKVCQDKLKVIDVKIVLEKTISGVKLKDAIKLDKKDLIGIEEKIRKIIEEKPGLNPNAYMGLVMKEMKGNISGGDAMEIIQKILKK